ncbi:MAG: hypothetical protein EOP06_16980 [Proteobacteria bacterium]|nr:MAG: hypothetical protein EOP06_16980 [Pseudomonadota bacterium]
MSAFKLVLLTLLTLGAAHAHGSCNTLEENPILAAAVQASESSCATLAKGRYRDFDFASGPTGAGAKYRLQRDASGNYNLILNIKFSKSLRLFSRDLKTKGPDVNKVWHDKAQACFLPLAGRFKSQTGEEITISLLNPSKAASTVPVNYVSITQTDRSNSGEWDEGVDCATILHETLHLVGLVDEYSETDKKTATQQTEFDCRTIATKPNIMANHTYANIPSGEKNLAMQGVCTCISDECQNLLKPDKSNELVKWIKNSKDFCPTGFAPDGPPAISKGTYTGVALERLTKGESFFMVLSPVTENKIVVNRLSSGSLDLLNEHQINAILYPGCLRKNLQYYKAADNAYRTSTENGGTGCSTIEKFQKSLRFSNF